MNINLELYRVFYFSARASSISKAAEELYISQPAVSQSIKQLEQKLGGQLFFRSPRGIKLTEEGKVLFRYIEQAYNFILTAEHRFSEMQNLMTGEIRIGASDTICKYFLLPPMCSFHREYPGIKMQVANRTTQETIQLLKNGKVDFGIINLPVAEDPKLLIQKGPALEDCFIAGEPFRELDGRILSLEELGKYPVLMLEKASRIRNHIDDFTRSCGVEIIPEFELGSIDLLVEFAKAGMGISCVIKDYVKKDLEEREVFEVRLKEVLPQRNLGIATLRDVPLTMAAKKFIGKLMLQ
jgi:LysR family transcriptional regulator, cyn operon transcriptional activator